MKANKNEIAENKERLLKLLKPGDTVYCNLKHVSQSGMSRVISLHIIKDNRLQDISGLAAPLLEGYDERHYGCKAGGCGMDMGFHLVYNLGRQLWPNGFPVAAGYWRNEAYKEGQLEDGGYALKSEWM
jgi:hypothetical protein